MRSTKRIADALERLVAAQEIIALAAMNQEERTLLAHKFGVDQACATQSAGALTIKTGQYL